MVTEIIEVRNLRTLKTFASKRNIKVTTDNDRNEIHAVPASGFKFADGRPRIIEVFRDSSDRADACERMAKIVEKVKMKIDEPDAIDGDNIITSAIASEIRKQGLSQYGLARDAGVSQAQLSLLLSGSPADMRSSTASKLMKYLGLKIVKEDE